MFPFFSFFLFLVSIDDSFLFSNTHSTLLIIYVFYTFIMFEHFVYKLKYETDVYITCIYIYCTLFYVHIIYIYITNKACIVYSIISLG